MGNFTTYGHSTVIDGYHEEGKTFYVHINYGAGGFRTGGMTCLSLLMFGMI